MWRELPLWFPDGADLVEGNVDLVFEEDGQLVVVDYKTDAIADEQALAQAAHHAPQLQLYGRGLTQAIGLPVRERLVLFTALGRTLLLRGALDSVLPAQARVLESERMSETLPSSEKASGPKPFSWSASRHDTFMRASGATTTPTTRPLDDPEIHRLKKLSALPLWAGSVVHDTIEAFLRAHDAVPSAEEQEALIRDVVHSGMLTDWRVERGPPRPGGPGGRGGGAPPEGREVPELEAGPLPFRLFEHEYGIPVEQEDKRIAVNIVMRSLQNFFKSDTLRRALEVGRERWLALEDLVSFHVGETEVFLRMDLAYRDQDGRVVIVDWKTGRNEGRFNEVQVAGYALYAAEQGWVQQPEEISTELELPRDPEGGPPLGGRQEDRARPPLHREERREHEGAARRPAREPRAARGLPDDRPAERVPPLQLPQAVLSESVSAGQREARCGTGARRRGRSAAPPVACAPRSRSPRRCSGCGRDAGGASSSPAGRCGGRP